MYVYLIQAGKSPTSPIKVGYSSDPEKRMARLQTGNHEKLRLILKIKCVSVSHARRLERDIHRILGDQNIALEWFRIKKGQLSKIMFKYADSQDVSEIVRTDIQSPHYSSEEAKRIARKKYKSLKKHLWEMEAAHKKLKSKYRALKNYIIDNGIITSEEIDSVTDID